MLDYLDFALGTVLLAAFTYRSILKGIAPIKDRRATKVQDLRCKGIELASETTLCLKPSRCLPGNGIASQALRRAIVVVFCHTPRGDDQRGK